MKKGGGFLKVCDGTIQNVRTKIAELLAGYCLLNPIKLVVSFKLLTEVLDNGHLLRFYLPVFCHSQ